jgi:hypothetical protein
MPGTQLQARTRRWRPVFALCLSLALCACSGGPGLAESSSTAPEQQDIRDMKRPLPERVVPPTPEGEPGLPPEALLGRILAAAAQHSGLPADALAVSDSRRVTWNDGSLGCPQPGVHYTQALVPGWRVIVQAGERQLDYRVAERGYFLLCEPDRLDLRPSVYRS